MRRLVVLLLWHIAKRALASTGSSMTADLKVPTYFGPWMHYECGDM